jgi:antitoxin component of MazEF toxin-antitoxin module
MIETRQKLIRVGSSDGVTIPAKELKREGLKRGDEVEVIVRPVRAKVNKDDQHIIDTAKQILADYKQDFQNLAKR